MRFPLLLAPVNSELTFTETLRLAVRGLIHLACPCGSKYTLSRALKNTTAKTILKTLCCSWYRFIHLHHMNDPY